MQEEAEFVALRHSMYASAQSKGWKVLWLGWVERWGPQGARDALIVAMAHMEASYQDLKQFSEGNEP